MTANTFTPGPAPNTVRAADGKVLTVPEGWVLVPPGDAALTRRDQGRWRSSGRRRKEGPEGLLTWRLGTGSDHRADSGRSRSRAIHRGFRQEEGSRRPTP